MPNCGLRGVKIVHVTFDIRAEFPTLISHQKAAMKRAFPLAIRKHLVLSSGVVAAWLLSSCWSPGKDWSTLKNLISGGDAESYFESGVQDYQSGNRQAAIAEFTKAIELDPSFIPAYDARAVARFQTKDYTDAIADCDKVIGLAHDDEHAYLIKGACRYYLHDIESALKPLSTAITMNPNDALARDIHGMVLAEFREWDDAIADFTKAIQLNPCDGQAYLGRAASELLLKEYEKSLADASNAIAFSRDNTLIGEAYSTRADAKTHLKDRAGAFADANMSVLLGISDEKSYITRASVEGLWDDFSHASNDLRIAIQINPTNSEIYLVRGMMEQKSGNYRAALADFSRGLTNDTEAFRAAPVYEAIGYAHAEMGQWQAALEAFRKAMAFNSPPDDVPFEVFLIESRMGHADQAKKDLAAHIQSIPASKAHDWTTSVAHYLAGTLNETDFLAQATATAKRPADVASQLGDAWYYAGMLHLLAGDKAGASERFKKSLEVGDDNSFSYITARTMSGF